MPRDLEAEDAVELPLGAGRQRDGLGERPLRWDFDDNRSRARGWRDESQQPAGLARLRIELADRPLALAQQPIALAGFDGDAAPAAQGQGAAQIVAAAAQLAEPPAERTPFPARGRAPFSGRLAAIVMGDATTLKQIPAARNSRHGTRASFTGTATPRSAGGVRQAITW